MKSNINAIIQSKNSSTLVLDFPRSIYDLYEKLQSVGIRQSPYRIPLSDEEGDAVRVKLFSESELGKHLLLTLSGRNALADVNLLTFIVDNAREEIRPALEQNILRNQYDSMHEVVNAARQMLYDSGPVKAVFYCPLVGTLLERDEDGDEYESSVDGIFLRKYEWDISEALEIDQATDESDMAEYFDEDAGIKAKLVSAKWSVESYRGRLFGKIECTKELIELLPTYQYERVQNTTTVNTYSGRSVFHPLHRHRGHGTALGQIRTIDDKKSLFEMQELQKISAAGTMLLYCARKNLVFLADVC